MARGVPCPNCGSFSVLIKEDLSAPEDGKVYYTCHCGVCGVQYGEASALREETLYRYDHCCMAAWKRNPNGTQNWMMRRPKTTAEMLRHRKIFEKMRQLLGWRI